MGQRIRLEKGAASAGEREFLFNWAASPLATTRGRSESSVRVLDALLAVGGEVFTIDWRDKYIVKNIGIIRFITGIILVISFITGIIFVVRFMFDIILIFMFNGRFFVQELW